MQKVGDASPCDATQQSPPKPYSKRVALLFQDFHIAGQLHLVLA
jgi:hypothetical protein